MDFALVSYHVPDPDGTAAGRALLAVGDGLRALGHEVIAWSWRPEPPTAELPGWCEWRPLPRAGDGVLARLGRLARPRREAAVARWAPPNGAVVVAEEFLSFPAVARAPGAALVLHYLSALDAAALGGWDRVAVQNHRAELAAARRAPRLLAYSPRVAGSAPRAATAVPIAYPVPDAPVPLVGEPVAAVIADWRWPPNAWALDRLLALWPDVREQVAFARLVLAGHGLERVGGVDGVEVRGPVARSVDVLAEAAVVAFPCPPTSGPKVKVLEAVSAGVPVVTTAAGVEGLVLDGGGALVATPDRFAGELADLLLDPERRSDLARRGRAAAVAHHGPEPAARARVAALGHRSG